MRPARVALTAWTLAIVVALVPLRASLAHGHGLDAGQIEVQLDEAGQARVVVTPPASGFPGQDADHDGLFSFDEVRRQRGALRQAFQTAVVLTDEAGRQPQCELPEVAVPTLPGSNTSDHLRLSQVCTFAHPPRGLVLGGSGFAKPLLLRAVRVRRSKQGQIEPIGPPEGAIFTGGAPRALLAVGAGREPEAGNASASAFVLLGARHVFEGLDHLLFIAALLLGAHTLRRLAAGVTAFTLGHTLALVAVVSGKVAAPSLGWVEPCIALSIALTAAIEIKQPVPGGWGRLLLAFGFGTIHGAGLAGSALMAFAGAPTWLLAPFAVGAELAQLLVATLGFSLLAAVAQQRRTTAAVVLTGVGVIWFVLRVAGAAA